MVWINSHYLHRFQHPVNLSNQFRVFHGKRISNISIIMVKFRYFIHKKSSPNNGTNDKIILNTINTWYLVFLNYIKTLKRAKHIICDNFGTLKYIAEHKGMKQEKTVVEIKINNTYDKEYMI
eukprot:127959_1